MRSSVVEPHPTEGFDIRGPEYVTGYGPPSNLRAPAPERPTSKPATQHSASHVVLAPAEGWFALVLLAIAVYTVVFSIIAAKWVGHTSILFWSTALGLLIGLLVAKISRIPQTILHLAACLMGHWLSIWLTSAIALHISWMLLLGSLRTVITSGLNAATAPGSEAVFLFYLTFLCFYLGYFGTWLTYRTRLPWLVAVVYCSIMLINLNYVRQDVSFLIVILLIALILLIARVQLVTQLAGWTSIGLHTDRSWLRKITWYCMQWACILALLTLLMSWVLPIYGQPAAGANLWNRLNDAWTNIWHGNLPLQNPGLIIQPYQSGTNFFGDNLSITGSVSLPVGEVLYYTSTAAPQYLEGFTYDHFDGHTWTLSSSAQQNVVPGASLPPDAVGARYTSARTDVTIVQPPDAPKHYIFAPAQPATFDVATTAVYTNGITSTWTQQSPLTAGEHYRAISNISTATAQDLSAVPLPGPGATVWVRGRNYSALATYYLQIPHDLSSKVLATARQWTAGATNTYDAVKMLETHLTDTTQFTYSVNNPAVPANVDVVSWLLQTRRGYCTYYASAMTIMARLLGIPARIVNGFSYGHFDAQRKVWVVNGDDAHSWVQIYFPNYGWINFDPTPGYSLNNPNQTTHPHPGLSPVPTRHSTRPTPTTAQKKPGHEVGDPGTGTIVSGMDGRQSLLLGLSIVTLLCSLCFLFIALCSYWWRNLYANANFVSRMFWRACRIASWVGMPPQGWQTPYEYSRMLSRHVPQEAAPLRRLTDLFVRDRWAAPHETPYAAEEDDLERLWPHLRSMFLRLLLLRISNRTRGTR